MTTYIFRDKSSGERVIVAAARLDDAWESVACFASRRVDADAEWAQANYRLVTQVVGKAIFVSEDGRVIVSGKVVA